MDEKALMRELLERATASEPPIGPMPRNALREGVKRRRRRRIQAIAAGAAGVAVVCVAALTVNETIGDLAATSAGGPETAYVLAGAGTVATVTPVSIATGRPGRPIVVGPEAGLQPGGPQMAVTPDGKTIWVGDGNDVTPISTATDRAGKPVRVVYLPQEATAQVLASPDGKAVYVLDTADNVTAVSTTTHRPRPSIELDYGGGEFADMAITPDGKTLYVAMISGGDTGPSYIIVINTARNRIAKRIRVPTASDAIVMAPDGKTAYVVGDNAHDIVVTPVSTATNTAGSAIPVVKGPGAGPVAMTPDGQTLYISGNSGVTPFATATGKTGKTISAGTVGAISPDGRTLYVLGQSPGRVKRIGPTRSELVSGVYIVMCTGAPGEVTPVATAINTAAKPIKVACEPHDIALTPDGATAYVLSGSGVMPIATATGQAGQLIKIPEAVSVVIAP